MCELDDFDRFAKYDLQKQAVSRRQFGAITVGAGLATLLPLSANAAEVAEKEVQIQTPDGVCDAHFVAPVKGAHAAVLVWPDIFGLRPAFRQMGRRLAEAGYAVLTVNPFYRMQKAPTSPENANFADPATRQMLMGQMGSLNAQTHATDAKAREEAVNGKINPALGKGGQTCADRVDEHRQGEGLRTTNAVAHRTENQTASSPARHENGGRVTAILDRVHVRRQQRFHRRITREQEQLLVEAIKQPREGCNGEDEPVVARELLIPGGVGVDGGSGVGPGRGC